MLDGEQGQAIAKLTKLVVKIGEVNEATRLIPIKNAQIAGVSYLTVGDPIFSFFDMLSKDKVKVSVPSWLNPAGMDMERWEEMGIDHKFAEKQKRIIQYYTEMGIEKTLTCTPYLIGHQPQYGDHLAWSESSAVSMANAYYGARTNREGGPSSLASAIIGYTADYGLHKEENRIPRILVKVEGSVTSNSDFSALGYWYGERYHGVIPYFKGIKSGSLSHVKMLGAAMAASGSVAHFHIENHTPEARNIDMDYITETISFDVNDKYKIYEHFNQIKENADLVVIGCPHAGLEELSAIHTFLADRSIKEEVSFWVFSSHNLLENDIVKKLFTSLEEKGVKIFTDTCMVVTPVVRDSYKNILTNSTKAAFYLTRSGVNKVRLLSLHEIVESVSE
jgi:predicted aconitase